MISKVQGLTSHSTAKLKAFALIPLCIQVINA